MTTADKIKELAEDYADECGADAGTDMTSKYTVEARNALHAAIDEMAKDAARYQWLRLQPFDEVRDMFALHGTEQQRDAAIDAAMKEQK